MNVPAATSSVCRLIPLILECAKEGQYNGMNLLLDQMNRELKISTGQEKPDIGVVLATLIQGEPMISVGEADNLPGSGGGLTMACFHGEEVAAGTKLYIKKTV